MRQKLQQDGRRAVRLRSISVDFLREHYLLRFILLSTYDISIYSSTYKVTLDYLNHDLCVCTIALIFFTTVFCVLCFTAAVCQLFLIN